ncbi:DUF4019 domain-containing protein [Ramlibacter alkalitolerans]|uniref:DUF4019 domain-containing protein n=1 Tax=Ramlibacter alkalitolerans TaxID=2039631 RepID=A0ABS1JV45_9BURK|nr:DUF4019 domain-containing protein [Ramlibacter alkalitolerans]MBL0428154.1 DUF4019 domain-containing protein [Ramlibacter alkalitolerans]
MRLVSPVLALGLCFVALATQAQLRPSPGYSAGPSLLPPPAAAAPSAAAPAAAQAPSANADKERAGQTAAHAWLLLLDRKDWGTAWDASSQLFRQTVPLPAWMNGIPKLRDPLGAFVERQPVDATYKTTLPGRPDGEYVTILFTSRFANKAKVEETVTTVREPDGRWRVTGYTAR